MSPSSRSSRRGRPLNSAEESHLRDLSPDTTLRAFSQVPMPFDTARDEFRFFACIETLTAAERDLGTRVARAAQRLKSWCAEIEQWGWSGSFEQPRPRRHEPRRRSVEPRSQQQAEGADVIEPAHPARLGSLLLDELESHERRLDDIEGEMLRLDVDELKEHVLEMFPPGRPSAGCRAGRDYKPMDDFSFLITQTLLSALPDHARLKDRLHTWTARVSVLREAPRYTDDLATAQKALRRGWAAIEPPGDSSDDAFAKWKAAIDAINRVLQTTVADLGRRLDGMLDTLEGHDDRLPDSWIDAFEDIESDYGRWAHDSTRRIIDFDLRRKGGSRRPEAPLKSISNDLDAHADGAIDPRQTTLAHPSTGEPSTTSTNPQLTTEADGNLPTISVHTPDLAIDSSFGTDASSSITQPEIFPEGGLFAFDEDYEFEEGDTVIHNEVDESLQEPFGPHPEFENFNPIQPRSKDLQESPVIMQTANHDDPVVERPHTPRSRRGSVGSLSSLPSFESSSPSTVEESPSVDNPTNRHVKTPRPELNATMSKRRPIKNTTDHSIVNPPWPPSQFNQKSSNSNEELDRKISDILTTIPAHIRLTSGPGADAPEVKSARVVTNKSSKGYLRATRSASGAKLPELTLSAAKSESELVSAICSRKSTAPRSDNDIKLYHLTQPGKDQPVKLFIRRVGENGERVMVRVGGGWADLSVYLRQYAEHHGRRTVSDGRFEVFGVEVKTPGGSPGRSESVMNKGDRRFSVGQEQTDSPYAAPVRSSGADAGVSRDEVPLPILRMRSFSNYSYTPVVVEEPSEISTGPSQHNWQGKEVGLAGPTAKKLELSDNQLEWVEGMMKLAKQPRSPSTSSREDRADSRNESRPSSRSGSKRAEFVDLGKVGGTKRIFLKEGSPHKEDLKERSPSFGEH